MSDRPQPNAAPAGGAAAHPVPRALAPFYWSVRRELWENRSLTRAPLAVAALCLLGFMLGGLHLPARLRAAVADPAGGAGALVRPFELTALVLMLTAMVIGVFYTLDALYGERRDRSILFWKSMPVSDLTAVLAKAAIPLAVLPAIAWVTILATQIAMLSIGTAISVAAGVPAGTLSANVWLVQMSIGLLYGFVTMALWHAPIYGWLLLVSSWARRMPLLWAVLPPLVLCVVEGIAFGTWHFAHLLGDRLVGGFRLAFDLGAEAARGPHEPLTHLRPARFAGSIGLWVGLGVAAGLLAVTVRMRRDRAPI